MRQTTRWKKWIVGLVAGATLLQTPTCVDTANVVTSVATTTTAVGVLYLVRQVID